MKIISQELKILQYNINYNKEVILISLLYNFIIKIFNILII